MRSFASSAAPGLPTSLNADSHKLTRGQGVEHASNELDRVVCPGEVGQAVDIVGAEGGENTKMSFPALPWSLSAQALPSRMLAPP